MTIEKALFLLAGSLILISTTLAAFHHIYWLFLTAFVGINMIQSVFTGFCIPSMVMKKAGMKTESETALNS